MRTHQRAVIISALSGVAGAIAIPTAAADTIVAPSTRINLTKGPWTKVQCGRSAGSVHL